MWVAGLLLSRSTERVFQSEKRCEAAGARWHEKLGASAVCVCLGAFFRRRSVAMPKGSRTILA